MLLPNWTPEPVKPILEEMDRHPLSSGPRRAIFERLVTDEQMRNVYGVLFRLDRKAGGFFHPARNIANGQSAEEAQSAAIREVLRLVVTAAGDRIAVTKPEQVEQARLRWLDDVGRLRALAHDLNLAAELGMLGLGDSESRAAISRDAPALLRVANWLEHLTSALRQPDDPLMVGRFRGDPIMRGVTIMIGVKMKEQFGDRLAGTTATLASVALATETSPRVSRSALGSR
jgi:hypothetical protein